MWWPESNLTLHFDQSRDYQRCLMMFYGVSVWVGWYIGLTIPGYCIWCCCVLGHAGWVGQYSIPTGRPMSLRYAERQWWWRCEPHAVLLLDEVEVLFDTGVFLWIRLRSTRKRWVYVVFCDQMTLEERRRLMWLAA